MDYKIVAIDMDGTLLNSNGEVSVRTENAIHKAIDMGVNVVISTGRILRSAKVASKRLKLNNYIIACNGGIIVDKADNIIHSLPINLNSIEKIMYLGKKYNVYYHFYNEDSLFSNTYVQKIADYYNEREHKLDIKIFKEPNEILNSKDMKIYKFLFLDNNLEKLDMLRNELNQVSTIEVSKSWLNNIEVMDQNASKGMGLQVLCKKLDISKDNVIAIGDNENDLSMIKFAGLGVSMGNASDLVKNQAKYITSTNDEDGVAKVIEKFILQTEMK